jgi:hypothetical protein
VVAAGVRVKRSSFHPLAGRLTWPTERQDQAPGGQVTRQAERRRRREVRDAARTIAL